MQLIEIWFDGGCEPNPGYGYGSYSIKSSDFEHEANRVPFGPSLTSNQAEYIALISALWKTVGMTIENNNGTKCYELAILSDSMLVVEQMNSKWKLRHPRLRELHDDAVRLCELFGRWRIAWHGRQNNVARFGH